MAKAIIMPRQGNSVESCIVAKWHKQKGDKVEVGEVLFTYETDKATFDEESNEAGTLLETFFEEGDDVPVLLNMGVIGNEGESVDEFRPTSDDDETVTEVKEEVVVVEEKIQATGVVGDFVRVSPRAKNLASKNNVEITAAIPTGPKGRIIQRDIEELIKNGVKVTSAAKSEFKKEESYVATGIGGRITTADINRGPITDIVAPTGEIVSEYEEVKLTNIRKIIGSSMQKSLSSMAQLTLNTSFDASAILAYRAKIKANKDSFGLSNITINDLVVYAVAKTLMDYKEVNSHYLEDTMKIFNTVHMGVAVDTERGLMVPTLFNSDRMTLSQLSANTKEIAGQSKTGTINPDLLQGGTFTITNLGAMGVESFTPVINPPQTAILGVCGITTKVKEINGSIATYPSMGLSLTINHMAVDGAPASRFLKDLCNNLENFAVMLLA